jgi:anti-sigma B factor antagonist
MEIQTQPMKHCTLVRLSGQIDSATAPEVEQALVNLIQEGSRNLAINLADVAFISSAGLSALLSAKIKTRRRLPPGDVVISEVTPRMRETFELVGLNHIFSFFDRDAEAVGSF